MNEIQKPSQEMDAEIEQVQEEKGVYPDQQKCLETKLTLSEETSKEDKVGETVVALWVYSVAMRLFLFCSFICAARILK